jgi:hypothetical protein
MEIGFLQEIGGLQEDQLVCGSIPMNCMILFQPHCLNVICKWEGWGERVYLFIYFNNLYLLLQFSDVATVAIIYKRI